MSIVHRTIPSQKNKSISFNIRASRRISIPNTMRSRFRCRWQQGTSYLAWQKALIRAHNRVPKRNRRRLSKYNKYLLSKKTQQNENQETKDLITHIEKIEKNKDQKAPNVRTENKECELNLITILKIFLEKKHLSQHIESAIPDSRNKDSITYSKQTLMLCALSIFLFRMASGNKYDVKFHDTNEKYCMKNISIFIDSTEDKVPVIKTIENFLKGLEESSVNNLMILFFKDLIKSKFFQQHPQLMPGDFFLMAADCVHTHTYNHPHHFDTEGNNDCPCCLKRVYNKGKENEKTNWMHITLVFSFVFDGGLKLPIFRYPIHAKQVVDLEAASAENHKQESELVGLKKALPIIRESFPKMKIVLLLDGLYANRPVIQLAEKHRCGYIIVKKEACLSSLNKTCDEIAETPIHKKNCRMKTVSIFKEWKIERKYEWFNSAYLGNEISTNVLRFNEVRTKDGKEPQTYKCEWLFSWRLSKKTCERAANNARARWEIEDIFNTLTNRGYNFKHDYSRDPKSCFNWQGIALFAFGIFELFRFSEAVKKLGDLPQITLAEKLQGQLIYRPTDEIFSDECLSKKIQFRYNFIIESSPEKLVLGEKNDDGGPKPNK